MTRKRLLLLVIIVAVLAALIYLQVREWRHFEWKKFIEGSEGINWWRVLVGVALIYIADLMRAIRWAIFLRPTRPNVQWRSLIAPQYIGFTGLALLGRPGEFVRPYLIARRANRTLASQVALWFVERACDTGAVTLIVCADIFGVPYIRENYPPWRAGGYVLLGLFCGFVTLLWALYKRGPLIAAWVCRRLNPLSPSIAASVEKKLRTMAAGLHAIKDRRSFLQVAVISLAMWLIIAFAYRSVTHAYPLETGLPSLNLPEVVLLMAASIVGGVIQLPVVGGGSQLATIGVLLADAPKGFSFKPELAVSCGMLLWLVTFMSVVPLGLALAHFEHVSLRELSAESEAEVESDKAASPSLPIP